MVVAVGQRQPLGVKTCTFRQRRVELASSPCSVPFFFLCPATPRQKFPLKERSARRNSSSHPPCIPRRIPPQGQRKGGAAAMRHTKSRKKRKTRRWLGRLKSHARRDWSPSSLEGVKGAHHPPVSVSPFLVVSLHLSVFPSCWASAHHKAGETARYFSFRVRGLLVNTYRRWDLNSRPKPPFLQFHPCEDAAMRERCDSARRDLQCT